jgi:hypothetical protein
MNPMRYIVLIGCLWVGCAKPALSPLDEVSYNTELFAASESGATCKEAVANVAKVEARWAEKFKSFSRPAKPAPELHCHDQ